MAFKIFKWTHMSGFSLLNAEQIETQLSKRLESIRLDRNITQAELAREAGVSTRTIRRMEKGEGTSLVTFIRVLKALGLDDRLDAMLPPQDIQPLQRVNKAMKVRERASGKRKKKDDNAPWQWGDE
ncbi:MAG: helix-turn-helix transcriptional regulator [Planctomycetota bacterium]